MRVHLITAFEHRNYFIYYAISIPQKKKDQIIILSLKLIQFLPRNICNRMLNEIVPLSENLRIHGQQKHK